MLSSTQLTCSSTCMQNDALKDVALIISHPFWKSSVDRRHRLREQPISSCLPVSPVGLDHPGGLVEGVSQRGRRREARRPIKCYQFATAGLLPPGFMFQSFKQLATESELLYTAVQRSSLKSWKSVPSIRADQCNKPFCSHSRSDASKKEREGRK